MFTQWSSGRRQIQTWERIPMCKSFCDSQVTDPQRDGGWLGMAVYLKGFNLKPDTANQALGAVCGNPSFTSPYLSLSCAGQSKHILILYKHDIACPLLYSRLLFSNLLLIA